MADLSDVYGQNFQTEAKKSRVDYLLNIISNNLSHRQFKFKLQDTTELWDPTHELHRKYLDVIIHKVHQINPKITVKHINKNSQQINMVPELIVDTPVEYFLIMDTELNRVYLIYMTPTEVHCY